MNHEQIEFPDLGRKWCCFDTETTGLTKWDDILQLTCINSDKEVRDEYFNSRRHKTWKKSMAVHKITPEMVKDKENIYARRNEFRDFFKSYEILLGYNVTFDVNAVYNNIFWHLEWGAGIIDVYHLWKMYKKKYNIVTPNDKLVTVAGYFGYDFSEVAHNACEDVYATIYVFSKILEDDEFYLMCATIQKRQTI